MTYTKFNLILILSCLLFFNCREAIDLESITFQDTLVVESTITNEMKHQEIKLSRTYLLEENSPRLENNATTVWVEDSNNNLYPFSQNSEGVYISDDEFQAIENVNYQLFITTQNGQQYSSSQTLLTPVSNIDNLSAELITRDNGDTGVQVVVDSDNASGMAQYFKYEYEETYKVVAPHNFPFDISVENLSQFAYGIEYDIVVTPREQEERICYSTEKSVGIIQTNTNELENNMVSKFPVRFINQNNSVLRDRYSILVSQYVQNVEAYTFYKTIKELGSVESLLSQSQPGYVTGNIQSLSNPSEKVLGYFEVCSVSKKRIFFSYIDFNIPQPSYFYDCDLLTLDYDDNTALDGDINERTTLYRLITINNYKLAAGAAIGGTIFDVVNPECGDCTSISSNIRPDFWVD